MPRYARETVVPIERTRSEIEDVVKRYRASEFQTGWKTGASFIGFRIGDLFVRFILPVPGRAERRFTHRKARNGPEQRRTDAQAYSAWEQECRSRWRALLLVIRAKLEAVECGISTIEEEFLAHVVMPNDQTIGDWIIKGALPAIRARQMPPLALPAPPRDGTIADAEFEERKDG